MFFEFFVYYVFLFCPYTFTLDFINFLFMLSICFMYIIIIIYEPKTKYCFLTSNTTSIQ
jgi:hypothetical protein